MESTGVIKESIAFSLSPELAGIAAKELNENPASRRQCITEMRQEFLQRSTNGEASGPTDEFLLRFLRCKKFDVPRALSVYEGYHSFRRENEKLFRNLMPENVRHIWEAGVIGALPHRDRKGRAVMVAFPGRWDPEAHSLEDMMRAMVLQLEHLICSVETQINGIVLIADFTDFSLYQARCIKPWYFQLLASLVQNAFPARFKGVFILNQPWYISFMMAIIGKILSEKMKSRMHVLGGDTDLLGNSFDMDLLPTEFGGTAGKYGTHSWTETMISSTNDDR